MKKFTTALFSILFVLILAPLAHADAISAARVLELVNAERAKAGLNAVTFESRLNQAAQIKASDMASKSYFDHVSPDGTDPWDLLARVGYDWQWAGENLALNSQTLSEEAIVKAWMASPGHRAIILTGSHTQTGIGIASGTYNGQAVVYVSQFFASPKAASAPAPAPVPMPAPVPQQIEPIAPAPLPQPVQTQTVETKTELETSAIDRTKEVIPVRAPTDIKVSADYLPSRNVSKVTTINYANEDTALAVQATTSSSVTSSMEISPANQEGKDPIKNQDKKSFWKINLNLFMSKLIAFFVQTAQAWNR